MEFTDITLNVGKVRIAKSTVTAWHESKDETGYDLTSVIPAYWDKKRVFVIQSIWIPFKGYSSKGISQRVVSLKEGLQLILDHEESIEEAFENYFE